MSDIFDLYPPAHRKESWAFDSHDSIWPWVILWSNLPFEVIESLSFVARAEHRVNGLIVNGACTVIVDSRYPPNLVAEILNRETSRILKFD